MHHRAGRVWHSTSLHCTQTPCPTPTVPPASCRRHLFSTRIPFGAPTGSMLRLRYREACFSGLDACTYYNCRMSAYMRLLCDYASPLSNARIGASAYVYICAAASTLSSARRDVPACIRDCVYMCCCCFAVIHSEDRHVNIYAAICMCHCFAVIHREDRQHVSIYLV